MAKDCGKKTVTIAGTPEPIGTGISGTIWIQAFRSNTGGIAVGCEPRRQIGNRLDRTTGPVAADDATQQGWFLAAAEGIVVTGRLEDWYIDAEVAGEGIAYMVM